VSTLNEDACQAADVVKTLHLVHIDARAGERFIINGQMRGGHVPAMTSSESAGPIEMHHIAAAWRRAVLSGRRACAGVASPDAK